MAKFIITTNSEVASQIQKFFRSSISDGRSIVLGGISENTGFTDVLICSAKDDELIRPEDIFWMGYYSNEK